MRKHAQKRLRSPGKSHNQTLAHLVRLPGLSESNCLSFVLRGHETPRGKVRSALLGAPMWAIRKRIQPFRYTRAVTGLDTFPTALIYLEHPPSCPYEGEKAVLLPVLELSSHHPASATPAVTTPGVAFYPLCCPGERGGDLH